MTVELIVPGFQGNPQVLNFYCEELSAIKDSIRDAFCLTGGTLIDSSNSNVALSMKPGNTYTFEYFQTINERNS